LKDTFHVFLDVLRQTSVQFVDGDEQKIRNVLLEILNRLPNLEVMGNYVNNLANVVMHILDNDNEDNAIICLKIIFEIHKVFSSKLEAQVQPFINFFKKLYYFFSFSVDIAFREKYKAPNGRAVANHEFANIQSEIEKANKEGNLEKVQLCHEHRTAINNAYLDQNSKNPEQKRLTRSLHSFKVLRECPLIVMLLFQLHPQFVEQNIRDLIPVMIKALQQGRGDEGIQNPPAKKELYTDFISAQVKTLSFLTYVLRGYAQGMEPHKDILPDCVIRLLRNCPADAINCRKELLVATRHILATEFRQGFMSKVDTLTDENILIGPGTKPETVRALAYSTVSDLINHVRQTLSLPQLNKVVDIFSKNIHDATLSLRIQTASVRLILNLVDFISRKQEPGCIIYKVPDLCLCVRFVR
jgi:transformation/transcription domain-associated protein